MDGRGWLDDEGEGMVGLAHLSSSVGHHVINAFSAIVSNAEILRISNHSGHPIDQGVLTELIIRTSMEASTVARRLIELTRTITKPPPVPLDLVEIARSVCEEPTDRLGVEVRHDLLGSAPLEGSEVELREMVRALVGNAVEAMGGGDSPVLVSSRHDERGWLSLEIHDSGPGMDEATLERALDPFFTTKAGHLGVGLCVANSIWRRHRGSLMIRSSPGRGTTITLMSAGGRTASSPGPPL